MKQVKTNSRSLILNLFLLLRNKNPHLSWGPTVRSWQRVVRTMPVRRPNGDVRKLLIVPGDPYTLTGSRGDDAMIEALISVVREKNEATQFFVITGSDAADEEARKKGIEPVQMWRRAFSPNKIKALLKELGTDALVVVGGDVMDGYYNPYLPFHALMFADMASRLGSRSLVLGFSFNKSPYKDLKQIFELTNNAVRINLRDAVSLDRFRAFCSRPAELVSDPAFCLKPALESDVKRGVQAWVEKTHADGRLAIAFNIHPMLFKKPNGSQVGLLVAAAAHAIEAVSKIRQVNWLFLPHDFREDAGDNACLTPLAKELAMRGLAQRVFHLEKGYSASELKAVAAQVDGAITARMHLAIGSLGMGRPVAALTYQDNSKAFSVILIFQIGCSCLPRRFCLQMRLKR